MSHTPYHLRVPGEFDSGDLRGATVVPLVCEIANSVSDGDIVCVGGCGFGSTTHRLMETFQHLGKRPKLYAFDTFGEAHPGSEYWEGHPSHTPWGEPFDAWSARIGGPSRLIDQFAFHLANSPARDYLTDWAQFPWWTVAEEFAANSVSYVIANGAHRAAGIRREIDKWWPTLKSGGKIAAYGHDSDDFKTKFDVYRAFQVENSGVQLVGAANHVVLVKP